MNIFSIIYLLNVFLGIKTNYEKIILKNDDDSLYIPIKLGNKAIEYITFSTMLPMNFFSTSSCAKCQYFYIEAKDLNKYTLVKSNVTLLYYYYNITGNLYNTEFTLGSKNNSMDFIAIDNIYDIDTYNGKGRYSLSFFNYFFNTTNKTFGLFLDEDHPELHLGGYNEELIKNETDLLVFNISKTNNSLANLYNDYWYINFSKLFINDHKIENSNFKLTFDTSTNCFHIPKDYFFSNAHLIFPQSGKCQVLPEGIFVCFCNIEYKRMFSTFKFVNENNQTIEIYPDDYIFFEGSHGDNYCYVNIMLNYDNDYFIANKYVMANYYNIFDIDAEQLKLYPIKRSTSEIYKERNFIISLVLLLAGIFLFISCYLIYRRYFSNHSNNENENNVDEEHLYYENINWDEIDALNEGQNNNENNTENENNENNEENKNENDNENNIENDVEGKNNSEEKIDDIINNDFDEEIENDNNIINSNNDSSKNDDENENNDIIFGGRESNIIN